MRTKVLFMVFSVLALLSPMMVACQQTDSTFVDRDSLVAETDTAEVPVPDSRLQNAAAIASFYRRLAQLESGNTGKINIVHIGDSHIQADLFSDKTRKELQKVFGNGGRGFTFPHRLAGTNGSSDYKFTSNARWEGWRNINSVNPDHPVGLSGNALTTKSTGFAIELDTKTPGNEFNLIRIITPENRNLFDVATAKKTVVMESSVPKKITHRIRSGEVLGSIARKYGLSVDEIKRYNGLRSDRIRAGKTLKIPTDQMEERKVSRSEFVPLPVQEDALSHFYRSATPLDKIYLIPAAGADRIALDGIVLENDLPGLIYHSIGVNGAKFSDFNKYPAFFKELNALQPDLVILSFGTNESFDKMAGEDFVLQMETFLSLLRGQLPEVAVLVMSPPPSLFSRRYPNTFAADYAQRILDNAEKDRYAAWDMYSQLGGLYGVARNAKKGLIGPDRVHYTYAGYDRMGSLLAQVILSGFDDFKAAGK